MHLQNDFLKHDINTLTQLTHLSTSEQFWPYLLLYWKKVVILFIQHDLKHIWQFLKSFAFLADNHLLYKC